MDIINFRKMPNISKDVLLEKIEEEIREIDRKVSGLEESLQITFKDKNLCPLREEVYDSLKTEEDKNFYKKLVELDFKDKHHFLITKKFGLSKERCELLESLKIDKSIYFYDLKAISKNKDKDLNKQNRGLNINKDAKLVDIREINQEKEKNKIK